MMVLLLMLFTLVYIETEDSDCPEECEPRVERRFDSYQYSRTWSSNIVGMFFTCEKHVGWL